MKKFIILLAGVLLSCTEIVFDEPQPVGSRSVNSFPAGLQGKFNLVVLNEETILEIGSNHIVNDNGQAYISDSLVVKKLGDRYVVNVKLNDEVEAKNGRWQSYVLEEKGCGFVKATSFIINSDSYIDKFIENYGGEQVGEGQSKTIISRPTAKQFNSLLADDSVTVSIILERLQ